MEKNVKLNSIKIAQMAMLTAISVVSLYTIPLWSIFPAASFLQYDVADVPVLLGTMLFGPGAGLMILLVVSVIQGLTISAQSGWVGIVMHFCASGALVLVSGLINKKWNNWRGLVAGLALGALSMTAVMIPLNLIFTVHFLGAPLQVVKDMLVPFIIPFNLIKGGLNAAISAALIYPIKNILKKLRLI